MKVRAEFDYARTPSSLKDLAVAAFVKSGHRAALTENLSADFVFHVLLALVAVIALARLLSMWSRACRQPPVIGEIAAGIVLGPSVLARLAPAASALRRAFVDYSLPECDLTVGRNLLHVPGGVGTRPRGLKGAWPGHRGDFTGQHSCTIPAGASAFAAALFEVVGYQCTVYQLRAVCRGVDVNHRLPGARANIYRSRDPSKQNWHARTKTCAAVNDVTAWCLLAFVVGLVRPTSVPALSTVVLSMVFVAGLVSVGRPAMIRLAPFCGRGELTQGLMATVVVAVLLSARTTELIGIHAISGAFALGAVTPQGSRLAQALTTRLEDLVAVLLLPAFFVLTGLRAQNELVHGTQECLICGLIVGIACLGKFGGAALAAGLTGMDWRYSSALGVLMNTRGLVELIVLNIGSELNVILPTLFTMLVLMALVTTLATTPIFDLIAPKTALLPDTPRLPAVAKRSSERKEFAGREAD
jgi:Kef-type K+ transport system membrane component KefB